MAEAQNTKRRKPWLAGVMSIIPGFGQLYNGEVYKAALFALLATWVVGFLVAFLMLHSPLAPPYNIFVPALIWLSVRAAIVVDAVVTARRVGEHYHLKALNTWYVYLGILVLALLVYDGIGNIPTRYYAKAYRMPAGSMLPTLMTGDHFMVNRWAYRTGKTPQRGDIIVFKYPEDETKDFTKRVIGMPGDVIEIRDKQVLLNGAPLDDRSYTQRVDPGVIARAVNARDNFGPVTVPQGAYFVLGDNRDQSLDSRFWGYVELSKIKGKVSVIYLSWDATNSRIRWERTGQTVR